MLSHSTLSKIPNICLWEEVLCIHTTYSKTDFHENTVWFVLKTWKSTMWRAYSIAGAAERLQLWLAKCIYIWCVFLSRRADLATYVGKTIIMFHVLWLLNISISYPWKTFTFRVMIEDLSSEHPHFPPLDSRKEALLGDLYTGAFVCLLATLPSYSDGELFFTDKTTRLVIRGTWLFACDISGRWSNKDASQGLLSSHQPIPSIVSKSLDYFGITVVAHAEEIDSHLEKVAVICHISGKGSVELRGVQLMGQVARLENQWHLINVKQEISFLWVCCN